MTTVAPLCPAPATVEPCPSGRRRMIRETEKCAFEQRIAKRLGVGLSRVLIVYPERGPSCIERNIAADGRPGIWRPLNAEEVAVVATVGLYPGPDGWEMDEAASPPCQSRWMDYACAGAFGHAGSHATADGWARWPDAPAGEEARALKHGPFSREEPTVSPLDHLTATLLSPLGDGETRAEHARRVATALGAWGEAIEEQATRRALAEVERSRAGDGGGEDPRDAEIARLRTELAALGAVTDKLREIAAAADREAATHPDRERSLYCEGQAHGMRRAAAMLAGQVDPPHPRPEPTDPYAAELGRIAARLPEHAPALLDAARSVEDAGIAGPVALASVLADVLGWDEVAVRAAVAHVALAVAEEAR